MSAKTSRRGHPQRRRARAIDAPRRAAYDGLRAVHANDAYANLVGPKLLAERHITGRDAAFATELLHGTCRLEGTYDRILAEAAGRAVTSLQPAVLDVLRLGAHQLLSMRVPAHAAVAASVDLAAIAVGERVTGLVNAVTRKVAAHDLAGWIERLSSGLAPRAQLALRTHHPEWIVDAYADVLPEDELEAALAANNEPPTVTLAVRPGLASVSDLVAAGAVADDAVPTAAYWPGNPADLDLVRAGRAGVQDLGSQRVALALADADAPQGPWLDLCAGPGGKSALLAGRARAAGELLVASELQPHRARLVRQSLRAYGPPNRPVVLCADATRAPWREGVFAKVMADVPCSGLGALRRRPEARWRRTPGDVVELVELQRRILHRAVDAACPGGVIGYVTCSPHRAETTEVVEAVLAARTDLTRMGNDVQLWPHRDGTDAMFLAMLRRR